MVVNTSIAGRTLPVALTAGTWVAAVAGPSGESRRETRRLLDVLLALREAVLASPGGSEVRFKVRAGPGSGEANSTPVELRAVVGPGDHGEPVMTVMLRDED
jgi:hypothetical protein